MESNRLTIIVKDSAVYRDQGVLMNLDLTSCGIPTDVHALQWFNNEGHIEYFGPVPNSNITELPSWASNCVAVWETAYQTLIDSQATFDPQSNEPPGAIE